MPCTTGNVRRGVKDNNGKVVVSAPDLSYVCK
jgi:hypothetical protein